MKSKLAPWLSVLAAVGLLSGCATFQDRPLQPEQRAAAFEQRTLQDAGLGRFLAQHIGQPVALEAAHAWTGDELTLAAFYFHPDLQVARAQWAVARAGLQTAGERPNPTLNVTPGYNTTTRNPSPWMPFVALDVPLETAGKRGYRRAQAGHLAESARLRIGTTAWQVRTRLCSALVDLQAARVAERCLRQQQALQAENREVVESQFAAGAISAFEATQARLAAQTAQLAWRDAQRKEVEARAQLAAALGLPARALENVSISLAGLARITDDIPDTEARRQALHTRADIRSALADYAASQAALQLEIARQYPDLHLGPGYQYDQGDNKWSLGFTLSLPVLNRNQGAIAEAEARRAEAAARFNALQAAVLAEMDRAQAVYAAARQKQQDAEALLTQLQQQEQRAQALWTAGEISRGEWTGLRLQLNASELARGEAYAQSQQAAVALEAAWQVPLPLFQGVEPSDLAPSRRQE